MKSAFWKSDWFAGVVVTVAFIAANNGNALQGLERTAYDMGVKASDRDPGDKVAVIAIDDESIANLGRWPWPRDILADMVNRLAEARAKVIGNTIFLSEPQTDPGMLYIDQLTRFYHESSLAQEVVAEAEAIGIMLETPAAEPGADSGQADSADSQLLAELRAFYTGSALQTRLAGDLNTLQTELEQAVDTLNYDSKLAASFANAGNVVQAMQFVLGEPLGNPDEELPDYVSNNLLINLKPGNGGNDWYPWQALAAVPPIAEIGTTVASIGHLNQLADVDGSIRTEPLLLDYYETYFPSLALQIAAQSLNLGTDDIAVVPGIGVQVGRLQINTDSAYEMHTFFYSGTDDQPAFQVDSFFDVFTGKIPVEKYRDKIVLIGATAFGLGSPVVTPISAGMEPVVTLAHTVSSILNEDFFVEPNWAWPVEMAVFTLIALYLILLLPRMKAGMAFIVSGTIFAILLVVPVALMASQAMWLKLWIPATLLLIGHGLLTTKRFLMTERGKQMSEAESAESNRMLGLAFQSQGQLDMAFEKFRKCPLDESLMDPLYNLALDLERKRQFNKAGAVYRYMSEFDAGFRDVKERMNRSKKMEETVMLGGGGGGGGPGATMLLDGGDIQKPMLGRYQVEKELGKGAMGIVYLGRDPKINRVVAIKTMALAQEFEEDELEEVKERFFREAESAGRLQHPNIVTIYDAGEEHDLAYIAMEFLTGKDLVPHTKPDNLLPLETVLNIVASCADGLSFAHAQNVVHRDIKPANIMYDPETKQAKITDFGIARITDSSKTKTGMVLGTPSYMSPEQLSGKKVDGRSDLFSLGVMLYQLTMGTLPFKGDSMATLMFQIANEPHAPVAQRNAELAAKLPCLGAVIDRALDKSPETRYADGAEMAADIRNCLAQLK